MKRYLLAILLFIHIALVFMLLGGNVLDTFVNFGNWFHNIPDSVAAARQLNSFRGPGTFYMPMMPLVILSGIGFAAAAWRDEPARIWVLVGTVLFVATVVLNLGFLAPRITTLIGEGSVLHPVETIQSAAQELQVLLQVRLVLILIGTAFSVFGLWRFYENVPKPADPMPAPEADETN
jgi:uncharacterized membrane protein YidH (DUF202 family)